MTVPLGVHGDGGSSSKQDSLFVLSWSSLVTAHAGFAKRFPFTIIRKKDMTSTTLDELWRVFGWSTNALLTGITPRQDYMQKAIDGGEWIADGLRAALIQLRGDWEFYAVSLGFPNWSKSEEMCWLCCASNIIDRLRVHNFGHDAPWRDTRR